MGVDNHLRVTNEDLARPLERPWIRDVNETSTKGVDLPPPSGNVEELQVLNLSGQDRVNDQVVANGLETQHCADQEQRRTS
jgi:hypothetical protein